jgi:N-acyl-D-amino-acid deacylase
MLAGHNTIRNAVMGFKMAPPSREDMDRMKALLEGEMRAGALGLSTGLAYLPGVYSGTEEIVELASAVAPYGGLYASHIRNQGEKITEAIEEAIAVGEANGIPVEVSHIKLAEEAVWNDPGRVTRPVEEARARGVEVYLDQYPYTATSSGFTSSFPQDVFEGGRDKFLQRMTDPSTRRRARDWIIGRRLRSERGIDKLKAIYVASCRQNPEYEGKNLEQILALKGLAPSPGNGADLIISIVESGDASAVFFQMDEADVATLMRLPYLMIGSDGAIQVAGKGFPHPRSYGTFTRVLGRYAREEGVLGLADAVRKMTSLPAQVLRLEGRGAVKKGMWADITVFDPATVIDTATFEAPHQYSRGVVAVLVNGVTVYSDGRWTGRLPGKILKGRGRSS